MYQQNTTQSDEDTRRVRLPFAPILPGQILCNVSQAAGTISRCTRWVYDALSDGRLRGVKSDGRTLVIVESLHEYIASLPPVQLKNRRPVAPVQDTGLTPTGKRRRRRTHGAKD
jgi:hypothetical protein